MIPNFIVMLYPYVTKYHTQRVVIRVFYKNVSKYFKTEIEITKEQFNPTGQSVVKKGGKNIITEDVWVVSSNPHHHEHNKSIREYLKQLDKAWKELRNKKLPISSDKIIEKANEVDTEHSVVSFLNLEIASRIGTKSYSTAQHYKEYFERLFAFYKKNTYYNKELEQFEGDDMHLEELTHNKLKEFQIELSKIVTNRKTKMSTYTVSKHLSGIKTLLVKNPNFDEYIFRQFRGIKLDWKSKGKATLSPESILLFSQYKTENRTSNNSRNILLFCYYCQGIRIGEALSIKNRDITNGRVVINVEKTRNEDKFRDILLSNQALEIIRQYQGEPDDYLFPFMTIHLDPDGSNHRAFKKQIESKTALINKYIKPIAVELGIKENISTHVARGSFITHAVNMNGDIYLTSQAIGHSDVQTTQGYAEANKIRFDELNKVYQQ